MSLCRCKPPLRLKRFWQISQVNIFSEIRGERELIFEIGYQIHCIELTSSVRTKMSFEVSAVLEFKRAVRTLKFPFIKKTHTSHKSVSSIVLKRIVLPHILVVLYMTN